MVRNRIILCIGIVLSGVFVGFYGGVISYTCFYLLLSIPLFSALYMIYVYIRFCVYQLIDKKTIVKGEHVPYQFILANEDFLTYTSVNVTFLSETSEVENLKPIQRYSLLPGEKYNYKTTLYCKYRGEYFAGIDKVQVSDFLGLFTITYPSPSTINVKVLPRIVRLKELVFLSEIDAKQFRISASSKPDFPDAEVRQYAPGDSMKQIHWKSSARERKLLTRKYMENPKQNMVLLMDVTKYMGTDLDRIIIEDKIIECTLSILDYFFRMNTAVSIFLEVHGIKKMHIHKKTEFDMFYKLVTDISFKSSMNMATLLKEANQYSKSQNICMIVTHTITEELCLASYQSIFMGNEVIILYINDNSEDERIKHMDARVHFYHIALNQDIIDVLNRR